MDGLAENNDLRFMMSYSRRDTVLDTLLRDFYEDLALEVARAEGLSSRAGISDIGFFDKEALQPGETWTAGLVDAIQRSRVLICVYSNGFFASENCGKEFWLFQQRLLAASTGAIQTNPPPPLIVPLVWERPRRLKSRPAVLADIQYPFTPKELGDLYAENGLRYLADKDGFKDKYRTFVALFAEHIVELGTRHKIPRLKDMDVPDYRKCPNAFMLQPSKPQVQAGQPDNGPDLVRFTFVAGQPAQLETIRQDRAPYGARGGMQWCPYYPESSEAIGPIALRAAAEKGLWPETLAPGADLVTRINAAQEERVVVVVVVDPWSLPIEDYKTMMRDYDRINFYNCCVIIPHNGGDSETQARRMQLEQWIAEAFPFKHKPKNPTYFRDGIDSAERLYDELLNAFKDLQDSILRYGTTQRRAGGTQVFKQPELPVPVAS